MEALRMYSRNLTALKTPPPDGANLDSAELDKLLIKQYFDTLVDTNLINEHFKKLFGKEPRPLDPCQTPVAVMGTGGMRKITDDTQIKELVENYFKDARFKVVEYQTISGKQEALYGWLAANYLLRHLPRPGIERGYRVGYLEMGGATAQVAFEAKKIRITKDDLEQRYKGKLTRVKLWGEEIDLYLRSFPLGGDEAWDLHQEQLEKFPRENGYTYDPCRPFQYMPDHPKLHIHGESDYKRCEHIAYLLLSKIRAGIDLPSSYFDEIPPSRAARQNNVYLLADAPEPKDIQWVGGAHFFYTMRTTFGADPWGQPREDHFTMQQFRREVIKKTREPWVSLKRLPVKEKFLERSPLMAAWVATILEDGFGFGRDDSNVKFQPYNGGSRVIGDTRPELSWTLGAVFIMMVEAARGSNYKMVSVVVGENQEPSEDDWRRDDPPHNPETDWMTVPLPVDLE